MCNAVLGLLMMLAAQPARAQSGADAPPGMPPDTSREEVDVLLAGAAVADASVAIGSLVAAMRRADTLSWLRGDEYEYRVLREKIAGIKPPALPAHVAKALQVPADAPAEEVKKAWRRWARSHHPDNLGRQLNDAEVRLFTNVKAAADRFSDGTGMAPAQSQLYQRYQAESDELAARLATRPRHLQVRNRYMSIFVAAVVVEAIIAATMARRGGAAASAPGSNVARQETPALPPTGEVTEAQTAFNRMVGPQ